MSDSRGSSRSRTEISLYQLVGVILLLCGIFYLFLAGFLSRFGLYIAAPDVHKMLGYGGIFLIVLGMVVLCVGPLVRGLRRMWRNFTDR